jgi:hypothetical protein
MSILTANNCVRVSVARPRRIRGQHRGPDRHSADRQSMRAAVVSARDRPAGARAFAARARV